VWTKIFVSSSSGFLLWINTCTHPQSFGSVVILCLFSVNLQQKKKYFSIGPWPLPPKSFPNHHSSITMSITYSPVFDTEIVVKWIIKYNWAFLSWWRNGIIYRCLHSKTRISVWRELVHWGPCCMQRGYKRDGPAAMGCIINRAVNPH
jgi:hypothetical protein